MNTIKVRITAIALLVITCSAYTSLSASTFADDNGAIRGYDPVAYHLVQTPTKGDARFTSRYNGSTWYFANSTNQSLFERDPEKYAPQYGGYCAYAMAKGHVASSDPNAWTIVDEKLYLNYSLGVRKTWLKDVPGYIDKANANWQKKFAQSVFE